MFLDPYNSTFNYHTDMLLVSKTLRTKSYSVSELRSGRITIGETHRQVKAQPMNPHLQLMEDTIFGVFWTAQHQTRAIIGNEACIQYTNPNIKQSLAESRRYCIRVTTSVEDDILCGRQLVTEHHHQSKEFFGFTICLAETSLEE